MKLIKSFVFVLLLFITPPVVYGQFISTIAGNGTAGNTGNGGLATNASLSNPNDVFVDASGNLFIISNNVLRKVNAVTGVISHIAGDGIALQPDISYGDGAAATVAGFSWMRSVCTDAEGNIYIADYSANNIRKVNGATGIISTVAGNNGNSYSGDGGPATNASIGGPTSIAIDRKGNLFIANTHNNRIRKVNAVSGIITTVAGNGSPGFSGDGGPATSATITAPADVYIDQDDNVFFIEITSGITCRVRKVDATTGLIQTVAGNGQQAFSGDAGPASSAALFDPAGIVTDQCGNIYISTINDSRVRKVNVSTGIITTIAGTGSNGFSGDGGPAIKGALHYPNGLSIDQAGNLIVADSYNNRIRKIAIEQPFLRITASPNPVCRGNAVIFTAFTSNRTDNILYEWKKNGLPTGTQNVIYNTADFAEGDVIECWRSGACNSSKILKSNIITLRVTEGVAPTISIIQSPVANCGMSTITLTAMTTGAINPTYQWKKNGINVGTNSNVYTNIFEVNDTIVCELSSLASCGAATIVSQPVILNGRTDLVPFVIIASGNTSVCAGTSITFNATNVSGTSHATFRWLVNGTDAGVSSSTFTSASFVDGAIVECVMTVPSCQGGSTKDYSNPITITFLPSLNPAVVINANTTEICNGGEINFTGTATQAGSNPIYQWKLNGNNAGTNNNTFTATDLADGDIVMLTLSVKTCTGVATATSNQVRVKVTAPPAPLVSISTPETTICGDTQVTFTATVTGAANAPFYQWYLNDNKTGATGPVYVTDRLVNGDKIRCEFTTNNGVCNALSVSNTLLMTVSPKPTITFDPSSISIPAGQQARLNAVVTGNIGAFQYTPAGKLTNGNTLAPTTIALTESITFKLMVTESNGCRAEKDIAVSVTRELQMPGVFTPNGDRINDVFRIPPGVSLTLTSFSIYDRWGNRVFTTNDVTQGWDGKLNGVESASNTYVYVISGNNGQREVVLKGTVILIR